MENNMKKTIDKDKKMIDKLLDVSLIIMILGWVLTTGYILVTINYSLVPSGCIEDLSMVFLFGMFIVILAYIIK